MMISPGRITCANVRCRANSKCFECAQNNCNTYTCEQPNGGICTTICEDPGAHCICDKGFSLNKKSGECVQLKCNGSPIEPAVDPKPVSEPGVEPNPAPVNV